MIHLQVGPKSANAKSTIFHKLSAPIIQLVLGAIVKMLVAYQDLNSRQRRSLPIMLVDKMAQYLFV